MLIVVIVGGMFIGYIVGQYVVDRYINQNHEDIDNDYSLRSQSNEREPKD